MTQVNVNPPPTEQRPVETVDTSGDRTTAAGINMVTVVIALVVVVALVWYLLTGPLHGLSSSSSSTPSNSGSTGTSSTTTISVNQPQPPNVNVNVPSGRIARARARRPRAARLARGSSPARARRRRRTSRNASASAPLAPASGAGRGAGPIWLAHAPRHRAGQPEIPFRVAGTAGPAARGIPRRRLVGRGLGWRRRRLDPGRRVTRPRQGVDAVFGAGGDGNLARILPALLHTGDGPGRRATWHGQRLGS